MTGPEHYAKAEELLARVKEMDDQADKARLVAKAQVHATLALAAATAASLTNYEAKIWRSTSGSPRPAPGPVVIG